MLFPTTYIFPCGFIKIQSWRTTENRLHGSHSNHKIHACAMFCMDCCSLGLDLTSLSGVYLQENTPTLLEHLLSLPLWSSLLMLGPDYGFSLTANSQSNLNQTIHCSDSSELLRNEKKKNIQLQRQAQKRSHISCFRDNQENSSPHQPICLEKKQVERESGHLEKAKPSQ